MKFFLVLQIRNLSKTGHENFFLFPGENSYGPFSLLFNFCKSGTMGDGWKLYEAVCVFALMRALRVRPSGFYCLVQGVAWGDERLDYLQTQIMKVRL